MLARVYRTVGFPDPPPFPPFVHPPFNIGPFRKSSPGATFELVSTDSRRRDACGALVWARVGGMRVGCTWATNGDDSRLRRGAHGALNWPLDWRALWARNAQFIWLFGLTCGMGSLWVSSLVFECEPSVPPKRSCAFVSPPHPVVGPMSHDIKRATFVSHLSISRLARVRA